MEEEDYMCPPPPPPPKTLSWLLPPGWLLEVRREGGGSEVLFSQTMAKAMKRVVFCFFTDDYRLDNLAVAPTRRWWEVDWVITKLNYL